jgi:hypothetical protein
VSSNISGFLTGESSIFIWDGVNPTTFQDELVVNNHIGMMKSFLGKLYIWTPQTFGVLNGIAISEIYPMKKQIIKREVATAGNKLFFWYPQLSAGLSSFDKIACFGRISVKDPDIISFPIMNDYFSSGDRVLAIVPYGEAVGNSIRVFWKYQTTHIGMRNIVFPQATFYTPTNSGYETTQHEDDVIFFNGQVYIKAIGVTLDTVRTSRMEFKILGIDDFGTSHTLFDLTNANASTFGNGRFFTTEVDDIFTTTSLRLIEQFNCTSSGAFSGIINIKISYEPVEGTSIR